MNFMKGGRLKRGRRGPKVLYEVEKIEGLKEKRQYKLKGSTNYCYLKKKKEGRRISKSARDSGRNWNEN